MIGNWTRTTKKIMKKNDEEKEIEQSQWITLLPTCNDTNNKIDMMDTDTRTLQDILECWCPGAVWFKMLLLSISFLNKNDKLCWWWILSVCLQNRNYHPGIYQKKRLWGKKQKSNSWGFWAVVVSVLEDTVSVPFGAGENKTATNIVGSSGGGGGVVFKTSSGRSRWKWFEGKTADTLFSHNHNVDSCNNLK